MRAFPLRAAALRAALELALAALVVLLGALTTGSAKADGPVLLDKVVAVVGDETITRSEVVAQARPIFARLPESDRKPEKLPQLYKELLDRMIDDLVVAREAERLGLRADKSEVEQAIAFVAEQNKLTRARLDAEVKKQGLNPSEYEEEIRRQLVDAKWTNLKVRPRVRAAGGDKPDDRDKFAVQIELERKKVINELRAKRWIEVRW